MTRQSSAHEYLEPCTISDAFITRLRQCSHRNDAKTAWKLAPGTRVTIGHGPFAFQEGVVSSWSGADRCKLLLWMLNRHVTVEVAAGDLVAIA